jgi:hypothetical protein
MSDHHESHRIPHLTQPHWTPVVIRHATAADRAALDYLAELDSAERPQEPLLLAQLGDRVVAALELSGGRLIASPFVATSDVQELLRLRAAQLSRKRSRSGVVRPWRRLARRPAPAALPDLPPGPAGRTVAA